MMRFLFGMAAMLATTTVYAQTAPSLDCTHINSAGPQPGVSQALRDYCAQHPVTSGYSHQHERELALRERHLAVLKTQAPNASVNRQIAHEQARIDTLRAARDTHVGNLRAADQLHRARFGMAPGPNPVPPARTLHPSPTTRLPWSGPTPTPRAG